MTQDHTAMNTGLDSLRERGKEGEREKRERERGREGEGGRGRGEWMDGKSE